MRKKRTQLSFIEQLRQAMQSLKKMKPGEIHVLSINANYGHYQIVIGPENFNRDKKEGHERPIEINGEIHHLFVSPSNIRPNPTRKQMMENMKNTVIMRNLTIHLIDPRGDGKHVTTNGDKDSGLHAREFINLAGEKGHRLLDRVEHTDKFSLEAYRIVQRDILNAIKKEKTAT